MHSLQGLPFGLNSNPQLISLRRVRDSIKSCLWLVYMNLITNTDARSLLAAGWSRCVARLSLTSQNRKTTLSSSESDNPALHSAMSETARLIIPDTSSSPSLINSCSSSHYNHNLGKWGLFYPETCVLAETPLVLGGNPDQVGKVLGEVFTSASHAFQRAVRSGKAAGLIVTCYSHVLGVANSPNLANRCLTPQ